MKILKITNIDLLRPLVVKINITIYRAQIKHIFIYQCYLKYSYGLSVKEEYQREGVLLPD